MFEYEYFEHCLSVPPRGSEPLAPVWNSLAKADCEFVSVYMSTGRRLMASLRARIGITYSIVSATLLVTYEL